MDTHKGYPYEIPLASAEGNLQKYSFGRREPTYAVVA